MRLVCECSLKISISIFICLESTSSANAESPMSNLESSKWLYRIAFECWICLFALLSCSCCLNSISNVIQLHVTNIKWDQRQMTNSVYRAKYDILHGNATGKPRLNSSFTPHFKNIIIVSCSKINALFWVWVN